MKIIIIGAGLTGTELAKKLISEKNDVVIIDNDEETVRHVSNKLDCMVIHADGNSLETLEEAGIAKADALIMLTNSDEVNMITCSLVEALYPEVMKIARVRNYEYHVKAKKTAKHKALEAEKEVRPLYGIDYMVYPDKEAALAILRAIEHGAVTDVLSFENSEYEIMRVEVEKGSRLDGQKVQDLRTFIDVPFLLVYLENKTEASLPMGSTIIQAEDYLGILAHKKHMNQFLELCGSQIIELNKIALVGAGHIGTLIADSMITPQKTSKIPKFLFSLQKSKQKFVIIDKDSQRIKAAAERYPSTDVFKADITDEDFIQEEKLATYDLMICATHNHEKNMVISAYLKSLGVGKTICLVPSSSFAEIARHIGVDVAIPIKDTVVDAIIGHLRGKSITGVHTVSDGDLEIIEYVMPEDSHLNGKALKDIAEPGSFLVLLQKGKEQSEYIIPAGNTILNGGDNLVLISNMEETDKVIDYFGGSEE
ncbi:MAG: Trk system potassium transporter TrkA [Spirochaetaceae bacterium]|nr:Trk system potassium transporter TrkA [Spirochaetaceae bacterium]